MVKNHLIVGEKSKHQRTPKSTKITIKFKNNICVNLCDPWLKYSSIKSFAESAIGCRLQIGAPRKLSIELGAIRVFLAYYI